MVDRVEEIRRRFASGWGQIGSAWGVAPSTAAVQGYLLLHGGPLTDAEIRVALGLSPRASRVALADCEAWGIIERATEPRRSGRRGPPGAAWLPVGDHWEWFRRVAGARKLRETDPVVPVLQACLAQTDAVAHQPGGAELRERLASLLDFISQFDSALSAVVRADATALERLFGVLGSLDSATLDRLLHLLGEMPEEELAKAAKVVSRFSPRALRRLVALAGQPAIAKIVGRS
ncbi:MAG: GbsR/MarR family transcriptional regulator [Candidatus Limnocylindrales bacterium]